jgi:ATP-dependent protease ClpP protease subunit
MKIINIDGPIGAAMAARALAEIGAGYGEGLAVRIRSEGGDLGSALAIAARLRVYGSGPVIGQVDEICHSAAVAIFAACRSRMAAANATFLLHPVGFSDLPGRMTAARMRAGASQLDRADERLAGAICEDTGCDRAEFARLMGQETLLDAAGAARLGLVTTVIGRPGVNAVANTLRLVRAARAEARAPVRWTPREMRQMAAMGLLGRPIGVGPQQLRAMLLEHS